jgi:hypothetical protein
LTRGTCALSVALVLVLLVWLGGGTARAVGTCVGVEINYGDDIAAVTAAHDPGTTYCINDGNYTVTRAVQVQSKDRFLGVYNDGTRPVVTGRDAQTIFNTFGSDSAVINGLQVRGAVGNEACAPNCGRGIGGGGKNLKVVDVRATNNANQGIGGTGPGLLVVNSTLDNNGYDPTFTGKTDGPVSSAGIKTVNSVVIRASTIRGNRWAGAWCDIDCTRFEVHDSLVVGNGKAGLHYEISSGGAIIEGNTIRSNGKLAAADRRADLLVVNSKNLNAYNNAFGDRAIPAFQAVFDKERDEGFPLRNIDFYRNDLNGDTVSGCELPDHRVDCYSNTR